MSGNFLFLCNRCNTKKSKCFAFGITYCNKPCPDCGKIKQRGVSTIETDENTFNHKRIYVGCLECNPVLDDDENIWYTDRVCCECFFEWKGKNKQKIFKKNDLLEENHDLRQQLVEVQKQLAEVLAELKKLRNNLNGEKAEKFDQQIGQNEKLLTNDKEISLVKVQEQVNKSQDLMLSVKVGNTTISPTKDKNGVNFFPYVIGGAVILVSSMIIGRCLMKRRMRN